MSISRDDPLQRLGGLLRVGDDRRDQVRHALVVGELDPLGVDQHHPHLVRRGPQQDRGDQRVDASSTCRRRSRRRRAGAASWRGWRTTKPPSTSLPRPTTIGWWSARASPRAQHVAEAHDLPVGVRDLDADRGLAGDRREDPHVGARDGVGDVLGQRGDPLDLDRGAELDLVAGHGRAAGEAGDLRVDARTARAPRSATRPRRRWPWSGPCAASPRAAASAAAASR